MNQKPWGMLGLMAALLGGISAASAECPRDVSIQVNLSADEFDMPGYDAKKGVLAIRPQQDLPETKKRRNAVRLLMAKNEIHMRVSPEALKLGLDQGTQALELQVEGRPRAQILGGRPGDCHELVPQKMVLKRDGIPIGDAIVAVDTTLRRSLGVHIKVSVDEGAVRRKKLIDITRRLARACGTKVVGHSQNLTGALSLQLQTSVLNEVQPVKVVVDGLVNQRFTYCLVAAIQEHTTLWTYLDPGTRTYINVYLTGSELQAD